ncbi:MAG: hypothetical protein ACLFVJ_15070 [Persicimonas sp.]
MTEDGKNEGNSIAEALEETTAPDDDATVQISGTELAAIRQSATSMELTAEELRQINRKRKPTPDDDEHDATRTFDRNRLDAMMAEKAEQAASPPTPDPVEESDEVDEVDEVELDELDELSEADMRAIVFGDTPAEGHLAEQTPDVAGEQVYSQDPDQLAPEFVELSDDELDVLPGDDLDEPSDDELSDDDLDELSDDDLDELSDAEFDELAQELSDSTVDEPEALDEPSTPAPNSAPAPKSAPVPQRAPAPQVDAPTPQASDLTGISDLNDEDLGSLRGAESRILLVGGTLASLAMLVVGAMRLWGHGYFTVVHPVMAGMFVAVGFLCLGAALIAVLQGRI